MQPHLVYRKLIPGTYLLEFPNHFLTIKMLSLTRDVFGHFSFNRIDIPPYETYEKLYDKLTQAVEETCGFAVE